jgi:inosine/guanosine/xanthosine phosphorylase family protein
VDGAKVTSGLAIIAGSGMGELGDRLASRLTDVETVSFTRIDGVGSCTVDGHAGEVRMGRFDGGGRRVALVLGRRHAYEGGTLGMARLMRWLFARGLSSVVAISAAGSLRSTLHPGELVVVKDIVDFQNRDRLQPSFRRVTARTDRGRERARENGRGRSLGVSSSLTEALETAARRAGVVLHRGVLACGLGPAYETPAEVRALQAAGADVATMSAAPEVQFAGELGMKIAVVAAITNPCTGVGPEPPDHQSVLQVAQTMCGGLARLVTQLIDIK